MTHSRLEAIFKQFDLDNNDQISSQNIVDAMTKMGREVSEEEIQMIMQKHDASGDRKISLEEFKEMMLGKEDYSPSP